MSENPPLERQHAFIDEEGKAFGRGEIGSLSRFA
jgi:hypothetical protein